MQDSAIVAAKNLGKKFPSSSAWAVRGLSFRCRPGEVTALLGINGAGKTTALRMLATMLSPTEGSAQVCGNDVLNEPRKVRRSIGILFGGVNGLYKRLTARENILYFARLNGMETAEANRRLAEVSELLDLQGFLNTRAGTFSTGMRQRTIIARSIIHDPRLLLLDEPATGLDVHAAANIYRFIERCRDLGKSVIFSSHDLTAAERLCDTAIILHRGETVAAGTPHEIAAQCGPGLATSLEAGLKESFLHLTEAHG